MIALFLAILLATLAFGAYLGTRLTRAGQQLDTTLVAFNRDRDIDDAADMASDGEERMWSM